MPSFKRFVTKGFIFLVCFAFIDIVLGKSIIWMSLNAKGGDYGKCRYVCFESDEECLIFGSSRVHCHYNPQILSDSLKFSCFNCGRDGAGIIQNYGKIRLVEDRRSPKLIIYDVFPIVDILTHCDNHRDLDLLRLYSDNDKIRNIVCQVDSSEELKMNSNLYRVNGKYHNIIKDYILRIPLNEYNGFLANNSKFDSLRINKIPQYKLEFDSIKISYLRKMVAERGPSRIIFVVSPIWYGMNSKELEPLRQLCKENNLPLIDFSDNPKYLHHDEFFYDGAHLNAKGADEFTKDLVSCLKHIDGIYGKD